jgi:Co/Zn/Cd efflux system component
MGNEHHQQVPHELTAADRSVAAQRATWVSVAVNLVMTIFQVVVGYLAHSQSLIAHGLHSFSDLLRIFWLFTPPGRAPTRQIVPILMVTRVSRLQPL